MDCAICGRRIGDFEYTFKGPGKDAFVCDGCFWRRMDEATAEEA